MVAGEKLKDWVARGGTWPEGPFEEPENAQYSLEQVEQVAALMVKLNAACKDVLFGNKGAWAERSGQHPQRISDLRSGKTTMPPFERLEALARAVGLRLHLRYETEPLGEEQPGPGR